MFGAIAALCFALALLLKLAGVTKWLTDLMLLGGMFVGLAVSRFSR